MGNLKNFATSLVVTAPSPATSGTSLVVTTGEGTRFPAVPFYATIHPKNNVPTLDNAEVVKVTGVSTDTFTIVRAQKSTTAQSITGSSAYRISNTIFVEDLQNSSTVVNEVPSGSVNGSNTAFTLASASGLVTGSLNVYKNGIRLKGGGADFTETSTGFTMVTAPATGTVLLCDYRVGGTSDYSVGTNSTITDETPTGSVNNSNTTFTTARAYIANSLEVYVNGVKQARTNHYTETTPSSGTFTMSDAPSTGDIIRVNYQYNLNPSSNSDTVDGIHASSTPTANQLMPLDSNAKFPTTLISTPYMFRATKSSSQSISDSVTTVVTWNTETYDVGGIFASNQMTAPVSGYYDLYASVRFNTSTGVAFTAWLEVNGTAIQEAAIIPYPAATTFGGVSLVLDDTYYLNATDTVRITVNSDISSGTVTIASGALSVFRGKYIGS